ncbi:hypothetical protein [Mesorhizobium sp. M7A.F.Ca.US.008.03.1.1]|uniref:hypothetical protein n=1 Tax=Mesorhizobium sp. M7A.F.Ca.US.008.03.1.1 TaxID=2496742 RepID=UPI000FCC0D2E|nr:hypothetical protein [Mesorhizobium sp. M7A.F.Ca.US.008.03.1.1]RUW63525.1 hypothetical protein EOA16_05290 [Mesorhizobium sp. M7A.F.Ca.US.008.03.1.1]
MEAVVPWERRERAARQTPLLSRADRYQKAMAMTVREPPAGGEEHRDSSRHMEQMVKRNTSDGFIYKIIFTYKTNHDDLAVVQRQLRWSVPAPVAEPECRQMIVHNEINMMSRSSKPCIGRIQGVRHAL